MRIAFHITFHSLEGLFFCTISMSKSCETGVIKITVSPELMKNGSENRLIFTAPGYCRREEVNTAMESITDWLKDILLFLGGFLNVSILLIIIIVILVVRSVRRKKRNREHEDYLGKDDK